MANRYELAYRVWPILTRSARDRRTLTYGEVARQLGFRGARPVRFPLWTIQDFCLEKDLPPLTILVVNKSTGRPGQGFFAWTGKLEDGQHRVFNWDWTTVLAPFPPGQRAHLIDDLLVKNTLSPKGDENFTVDDQAVYVNGRGPYQTKFRMILLHAYRRQCALCDSRFEPVLVASHIIPWAVDRHNRLNPQNGLLLCRNHDALFDKRVIAITSDYRVSWGGAKKSDLGVDLFYFVTRRTRRRLRIPLKGFEPNPDFLAQRLASVEPEKRKT